MRCMLSNSEEQRPQAGVGPHQREGPRPRRHELQAARIRASLILEGAPQSWPTFRTDKATGEI